MGKTWKCLSSDHEQALNGTLLALGLVQAHSGVYITRDSFTNYRLLLSLFHRLGKSKSPITLLERSASSSFTLTATSQERGKGR